MFLNLFTALRDAKLPVSLREFLTLLEGVEADIAGMRVDDFYHLARTCLVKDERHLDRFDQVFGQVFKGIETLSQGLEPTAIPEDWLRKLAEKHLTEAERAEIAALGWDKLFETLKQRLAEQKGRHQGGSKWIGTAGTSPFGAYGDNPEGVRIGQEGNRNFRAVKVWDQRVFRDFDDRRELGVRNMRLALRKLRRFARTGAADELDLDGTIRATADHGYLDVRLRPERRNAVKVLLFLDVGGSMDWHIGQAEELFSAARAEFKHFEHFYFHNCPYERVWRENHRRHDQMIATWDVLRTYPSDYRCVFVGDAAMSPHEIVQPGGSVEHWNEEAGHVWMGRLIERFPASVWLNPVPLTQWGYTHSIGLIGKLMGGRMFPLTLDGLERAIRALAR
ncbi:MAG: VWA domain-containing protein [Beijerinckiaceae bacterium]|jgi:uncharacterized protein with von Willebrand factor type A (vWA) domain|nr:VWA domain-containing protein [Beijerinckiaceae bacterium]